MNRFLVRIIFSTGLLLTSCGFGGSESSGPGISGIWSGEEDVGNQQYFMQFTLRQSLERLTGTYICNNGSQTAIQCPHATGTVSGTVSGSQIDMTMIVDGSQSPAISCTYNGVLSGSTMGGGLTCTDGVGDATSNPATWSAAFQGRGT